MSCVAPVLLALVHLTLTDPCLRQNPGPQNLVPLQTWLLVCSHGFQCLLCLLICPCSPLSDIQIFLSTASTADTWRCQGPLPDAKAMALNRFLILPQLCRINYYKLSCCNKPLDSTFFIAVWHPCLNSKECTSFFLIRTITTRHGKCLIVYFLITANKS